MFKENNNAIACKELLKEYETRRQVYKTSKINFSGVDGYDVYNISPAFEDNGETYIAGRVEKRDSEISCIKFFKRIDEANYQLAFPEICLKNIQDPCVTRIDGDLVVGGTYIDIDPAHDEQIVGWRTMYLRGKSIKELKFWREGPHKMKDVRILQYGKKLITLARPQGYEAGMGKISAVVFNSPEDFNHRDVERAPIDKSHFIDGEWGGANEMHILQNGLIGVLGHISYRVDGVKGLNYQSMAFCFNPQTLKSSQIKIIAERSDFTSGESKRPDLKNVIFSGGIVRLEGGKARLYVGASDCEAHYAEINDPFIEYEKW